MENEEKPMTEEEISNVIKEFHNTYIGHHGINSTVRMLKRKGFECPKMNEYVKDHIERCATCQKIRLRHSNTEASSSPRSASYPYEQLEMDFIGPFPDDAFGNKYILVIIDCFTRYTELIAVEKANAYCTASAIISICGRYGTPKVMRSDKGSHFVNAVIEDLMTFLHVKQLFGIANAPNVQGIVERANQEVIKHLQAICMDWDVNSTWSTYLPLVQRILNLSLHSEIGTYPQRLLFGDVFAENIGLTVISDDKDIKTNYVKDLNEALKTIIQASFDHQTKKINARKADQSSKEINVPVTEFVPGSYVLVEYNQPKIVIKPTKLHPYWQGPWIVLEARGNLIICKNLVTQYVQEFHRSQLKRYLEGGQMTPHAAALKDLNEIPVEAILDHRYSTNPVTGRILLKTLEFLVKWTGHPEEDNSWLKYAQLRNAQAVDEYIKDKPEFRQISYVPG
jgi:hypothetical protein